MLLFISKLIAAAIYPIGLTFLLSIIAIAFFLLKKKKIALIVLTTALSLLYLFSNPIVSHYLVRSLESKFSPPADFPKVSAIVVLGGASVPAVPPRRYVETNQAGDRIMHGARLFKKGYAPYLVCTGGKIPFMYDFPGSEALCMATLFRELWGIDSAVILLEDKAQTTRDHAPLVMAKLKEKNLPPTIIVVTSAMHMYRSVGILKKAGFTVYPAPTDYYEDINFNKNITKIFPEANSLLASTVAIHEYYGILAYKIKGWM
jgi:uncharacterized SAM-binding protein YcdF (DUF218 family)